MRNSDLGFRARHVQRGAVIGRIERAAQRLDVGGVEPPGGMARLSVDDSGLDLAQQERGQRRRQAHRILHERAQQLDFRRIGQRVRLDPGDQPVGGFNGNILRRVGLVDEQVHGDIGQQLAIIRRILAVPFERADEIVAVRLALGED